MYIEPRKHLKVLFKPVHNDLNMESPHYLRRLAVVCSVFLAENNHGFLRILWHEGLSQLASHYLRRLAVVCSAIFAEINHGILRIGRGE